MTLLDILFIALYISLFLHVIMIGVAVWRVWRGENVIDRLIGTDLVSTLFLAVLVLISLIQLSPLLAGALLIHQRKAWWPPLETPLMIPAWTWSYYMR